MPIFLDRHDFKGMTAADMADAHRKDLELQTQYGVHFLTYWFDDLRGTGFCLIDAPDAETAKRVHAEAHGAVVTDIIPVDLSIVEAFLGRIADPAMADHHARRGFDSAFRAVMFTDIVNSTGMTARLGDVRAVELVRAHDAIVRRALADCRGREIKHTGDGIMSSFDEAAGAVAGAIAIQRALKVFNLNSEEKLEVRIGIDAGEPVADSDDLFGATVQRAARICAVAMPGTVVVSDIVRGALDSLATVASAGPRQLKGFSDPVELFIVDTENVGEQISARGPG